MAGLETSGSNPDVSLLYDINGLARSTPGWLDRTVQYLGEYGLPLGMVVLLLACFWTERRRAASLDAAAASAAAVVWAPLGAAIAVLVNVPIRGFVGRPRPFHDHEGLDVLAHDRAGFSFVSDHATLTMAVAAGLFVASRKFGLMAMVMALAEGFCRVFAGVQYPTDVVGGFALGTAVALLLSPLATAALTPLTRAMGQSMRAGWLIRSQSRAAVVRPVEPPAGQDVSDREVHEGRQEQCCEPTRPGEHQVPVRPGAQERQGRHVRESRGARQASQDRDEAGRRAQTDAADAADQAGGPKDPDLAA